MSNKNKAVRSNVQIGTTYADFRDQDLDYIAKEIARIKEENPGCTFTYECEMEDDYGSCYIRQSILIFRVETQEEADLRYETARLKEEERRAKEIERLELQLRRLKGPDA